jgi:uncharacterized membrane protein YidH (DUF202 family)
LQKNNLSSFIIKNLKFMNAKKIGFVLVIIGAIMMFYTGFNYVTTEKIVDRPDRDKQTTKSSSTMVTNRCVNYRWRCTYCQDKK